jgi:diguanylate cyclase (GGDEF)-like protein
VGVIIVLAGVLSQIRSLDQWFGLYVGVGSMLAVGLSMATATVIHGTQSSILSHAGIMYAVIIIYSFVGLRFYHAMMAGWLGGLLGVTLTLYLHGDLNWQLLHRTYTGTCLLGMALAYAIDYRSRHTFVQALALEEVHRQTAEQNRRLEALTREDGLTGLANRRHLDNILSMEWERAMRQQEPLALLMIDVDHFKAYNDHLGHPAGDVCLREIAIAILQMARRSGDVAARYGGEEFALVFPATYGSQALGAARQLVERVHALRLAHPCSSVGRAVSVSVGVAVIVPQRDQCVQALIAHADEALYQAKSSGRNRAVLYGHESVPTEQQPTQA